MARRPRECRSCASRPNLVILEGQPSAGLNDRTNLLTRVANLAGSLCATLAVESPCRMLTGSHLRRGAWARTAAQLALEARLRAMQWIDGNWEQMPNHATAKEAITQWLEDRA